MIGSWFEKIKFPLRGKLDVFLFFSSSYLQIERACSPSTYTYFKKKNVVVENDECQLSNGGCTTEKKMWVLNINRK